MEVAGQALAGVAFGDFHDLRHTGNHIAAATGVSPRELIGRMGHSITRAALIYQQRTAERDRLIASVMSEIADTELSAADRPSGTRPICSRRWADGEFFLSSRSSAAWSRN